MKCSNCEFENPDSAKFCVECVSPMEFRCPECGQVTLATGRSIGATSIRLDDDYLIWTIGLLQETPRQPALQKTTLAV